MEGEQNINLIRCIISSVAVYLFSYDYLLAFFFFLKVGAKITIALGLISIIQSYLFCVFKPPLPPDIENNSTMIDPEKEVVIYFWYGKPRLNAFSGI